LEEVNCVNLVWLGFKGGGQKYLI